MKIDEYAFRVVEKTRFVGTYPETIYYAEAKVSKWFGLYKGWVPLTNYFHYAYKDALNEIHRVIKVIEKMKNDSITYVDFMGNVKDE